MSHEPGKEFRFNGLSVNDFVKLFNDPAAFGQKVEDSLRSLIVIDSVYGESYTSWLPVRFNLGGSYSLNENNRFNLLLNGVVWANKFYPAVSGSYNFTFRHFLELMVSYNVFNNQYSNIGGGVSISAGPLHIYAVSDNIPGLLAWKSTNNYSFQVGINILLGQHKNEVQAEPEAPRPESNPTQQ